MENILGLFVVNMLNLKYVRCVLPRDTELAAETRRLKYYSHKYKAPAYNTLVSQIYLI
jgi:hypothetical protein